MKILAVEIQGQVERLTYSNEETGYTVAKVRVQGRPDLITVVGHLASLSPGEVLTIKGEWSNHPQYGRQFNVLEYRLEAPASVEGISKYLGSGLIKGLGPVMAQRLVERFGTDTLRIIDHEADRLLEVEGLGPKKLEFIKKAWAEQKDIRRVMVFLQEYGVGPGYAVKIFKTYGEKAVEVVRQNPYRLAEEVWGIGFLTADRIASRLGFEQDDQRRIQAGLVHVLHEVADEGHVYYPYKPLLEKCRDILEVEAEVVAQALKSIADKGQVVVEDLKEGADEPRGNHAVYLGGYHTAETAAAKRLAALRSSPKSFRLIDAGRAVAWVQRELSIKLAARQEEAVRRAVSDKLVVITGGPGTGKTTIIKAVLKIFERLRSRVLLAAPTGRAAKRMTEATGCEARTIHRLLEFTPLTRQFKRNARNPLDCDLLVIDEASMIDILLMHYLMAATPPQSTLILVGDVDQLPSVGPGNVLRDVIDSGISSVVRLDEIFRQARESSIVVNAHRINQGRRPVMPEPGSGKLEDFYFIERPDPEDALSAILDLVAERIPRRFGFHPVDEVQVLSPMHRGVVGAEHLNESLQKALNPRQEGIQKGERRFHLGDKVMQVKNNYDKEVFNGDIGRITSLYPERQELVVSFDNRPVKYDFNDLDELVLAYAVSVHKAQGSEYPAVVMPVVSQHSILLQRNLIYTAVTRGKKLVVMVGSQKALETAVRTDKTKHRFTRLAARLRSGSEN
ncbi:MAG: ATP-dependent RecD-like DNA helicase [Pseudomonadota bacterium]